MYKKDLGICIIISIIVEVKLLTWIKYNCSIKTTYLVSIILKSFYYVNW